MNVLKISLQGFSSLHIHLLNINFLIYERSTHMALEMLTYLRQGPYLCKLKIIEEKLCACVCT